MYISFHTVWNVDCWQKTRVIDTLCLLQIYGRYPFDVKEKDYAKKFYNAEYPLPKEVPASPQCIDLLKKLLISKPDQRLGIDGIMKHPWFLMELPEGALEMNKHYLAKAPKYTEEVSRKRHAQAVCWTNMPESVCATKALFTGYHRLYSSTILE